ncbi:MAG: hypothetical protein ACLGIJ_13775 [Candidatus Limnocylindria bacterium]
MPFVQGVAAGVLTGPLVGIADFLVPRLGRPHIMRVLRTLSPRFGADAWWLPYR